MLGAMVPTFKNVGFITLRCAISLRLAAPSSSGEASLSIFSLTEMPPISEEPGSSAPRHRCWTQWWQLPLKWPFCYLQVRYKGDRQILLSTSPVVILGATLDASPPQAFRKWLRWNHHGTSGATGCGSTCGCDLGQVTSMLSRNQQTFLVDFWKQFWSF